MPEDKSKAVTRKNKTPIYIDNDAQNEGGSYTPKTDTELPYGSKDYISLNFKKDTSPSTATDLLKHELVHQTLANSQVPWQPANNTFADWNRAGNAQNEVPAYMSIFQPQNMQYHPTNFFGVKQDNTVPVSTQERDSYMSELMGFLEKTRQAGVKKALEHIINTRAAYNGTGLFPDRNK